MLIPSTAPPKWMRLLRRCERHPLVVLPMARRALAVESRYGAAADSGWASFTLGYVLLRADRLAPAQRHLQRALLQFESLQSTIPLLHTRRVLLIHALLSGAGAQLQREWEALIADYHAAALPLDAARSQVLQALHLHLLGCPADALRLIGLCAPVLEQRGTLADRALLLRITGTAQSNAGDLEQADASLTHARQLFARLRYRIEQAKCELERGWNWRKRGNYSAANSDLTHAQRRFQRLGLRLNLAFCEKTIGVVAGFQGAYDRALVFHQRARAHFEAFKRHDQAAGCDLNIGNIAFYCGLYELALAAYRRAETIYAEIDLPQMHLTARMNQGLALLAHGEPEAARRLLESLEAVAESLGSRIELATIHQVQGEALHAQGDDVAALARLQAAEAMFRALDSAAAGDCQVTQGWIHLALGDVATAECCFHAAREQMMSQPRHLWRACYGLARCAELVDDSRRALESYLAASHVVADLRRSVASEHASSGVFKQAQAMYADALRVANAMRDAQAVLTLSEHQRALAFRRQTGGTSWHIPPSLRAAHEQVRGELRAVVADNAPPEQVEHALQRYIDLLLRTRHAEPLPEAEPLPSLDLVALRAQLTAAYPQGWLVLNYIECGGDLLAVTLSQDDLQLTSIAFDPHLRRLMEHATHARYRNFTYLDLPLMSGQTQTPWAALAQIADRLLPPAVRARLHSDLRLLIIPTGVLHGLPWSALREADAWLCQRAVIQVLPALSLWPVLTSRSTLGHAALLIGCGSYNGRAPDLPFVAAELDRVAALWQGDVTRLHDSHATTTALRALSDKGALRDYGLLHIACHAQLVAGRGLLAHVKLWDDDLLLDDVARLRLAGTLVVLAACEGTASEVLPGEEILSLSHAFVAAGARDVIASLWPVYDRVLHELLAVVYAGLMAGLDAPTALTHAQRAMIDRALINEEPAGVSSPLVWVGFQAMGAGAVHRGDS